MGDKMLLLVATVIDGQERKKKISVATGGGREEVVTEVEKVFGGEGLGTVTRIEVYDEDFQEYVDVEEGTEFKDKGKLKVVFSGQKGQEGKPSQSEMEKDKLIDQLKARLNHLETNMKLVNAKAFATSSETLSQRSAASDLRRLKAEAKAPTPTSIPHYTTNHSSAGEEDPFMHNRQAAREEKKRLKKQEFTAEMDC